MSSWGSLDSDMKKDMGEIQEEEMTEKMTKQMGGKRDERMFSHVRRWQTDEWRQNQGQGMVD